MDLAVIGALEILSSIAVLVIISLGLAVIFGMMRVINIAHGEFIMVGGYATVLAVNQFGVPVWIAMLVVAPVAVGLLGLLVEACLVRFLYGRMVDTLLATWGLSLFLIGFVTVVFGNSIEGISAPLTGVAIGDYRFSLYTIFLIVMAVVLLAAIYSVLRFTQLGLIARGTMQNSRMAATLGIDPGLVYRVTFVIGAALSGLAGGLMAPVTGVVPTMGAQFVAEAFITVITGGSAIVVGTLSAAGLLGATSKVVTLATTTVYGNVALLLASLVLLRLLPQGITGRFFRRAT